MNIGLMILWSLTTTTAYGQESNSIISKVQFAFDQQALFQRADKNADGIIVLNELVPSRYLKTDKKLEGQFDKLDTDFSGSLSKDEILTAHKKRNVENRKYQKSKRDRLIKKFDLDNNGEISTYEFEQVQASIENDLSKLRKDGVSENLQTAISGLGERYKTLLDTNTDGSVSEDEILKHLQKQTQGKHKSFQRQRDKLIKQYDLDNNGTISFGEIDEIENQIEKKNIKWRYSVAKKDFEYKDTDRNNIVSLEEYKNSHQRPRSRREKGTFISRDMNDDGEITFAENEEFIESLFLRLDVDKDGQLSAIEQKVSAFKSFQKISFSTIGIRQ